MMVERDEFLWVESYRPRKVEDCVLSGKLKQQFLDFVKQGSLPNMMFVGGPGVGKTTVALALCDELNMDYLFINASEESGIDTLRTKIRDFASSQSLTGDKKMVILDEADYLNPNSFQPALRGAIEEFSANCRFILTANHPNRLIPAIHSRCRPFEFRIDRTEKPKIAKQFLDRAKLVLEKEGISYDEKSVAALIVKYFPDFRRVLGELQAYASGGKIDSGILVDLKQDRIFDLVGFLKNKDFKSARKWVAENGDEPDTIYRQLYDTLYNVLEKQSIPPAILLIGQYQYQTAFVADPEVQLVALCLELMANCQFKS